MSDWRTALAVTAAALALAAGPAAAQEAGVGVDVRFDEVELPAPTEYRTASGRPGPAYWQQRADYEIAAELDPETARIAGSQTIVYENHSPDTLAFLWLHLDQNLFARGSRGSQRFPAQSRFGGGGFEGGFTIARVAAADGTPLGHRIEDTLMRVDLAETLVPGGTTTVEIDWSFPVPENGADRMGHDGDHYLVAQWYPRMVVYDDIDGWNTMPYLGQGEFYLEYGSFDVELTVPAEWIVGATGKLENPGEVLAATQLERIAEALETGDIVSVVAPTEVGDPAAFRPRTDGTLTWRFRAEDVRDFTWAAGPRIVWDATSVDGVLIHALYRPEASAWREAAEMTAHSIAFYSEMLGPYPYPTATAVEGPMLGMEYPMIVFVTSTGDRGQLFEILDHEWGHMWFPMMVGSDERRYAWMDEGIDTFVNQFSAEAFLPASQPFLLNMAQYAQAIQMFREQPIGTHPDLFSSETALGIAAYVKPAVMLNALRAIVGEEVFDGALADYVDAWAFKHPRPTDFFRFMEDRLGTDLDRFWQGWIYTTDTHDVAILGQEQSRVGDRWRVTVTVDQRGELVMPARVVATTADGTTAAVTIPMESFHATDRATATLELPGRAQRIEVNAGPEWGDVNPRNNTWTE